MRVHTDWLLTAERAAVHLPTATAVLADLHLGYGEARRARGEAVPVQTLEQCLAPLERLVSRQAIRRLVIAGDLFEDGCKEDLAAELLAWVEQRQLELAAVVPGNHDRGLEQYGRRLPIHAEGFPVDGWLVLHGDGELPAGRVVHGHFHPCLRWGRQLSAPCYLIGADRLVLPAFTAEARGVNVLRDRRWGAYRCCAAAGELVVDLGEVRRIDGRAGSVSEG
jgi:putative SbcD/Mre11-related phosphoesterase